MVVWR